MSIVVQGATLPSTDVSSGATIPVTFGAAVTAGNTIVAAYSWDTSAGVTIVSVTDGLANTYRLVEFANDTVNQQALAVYIATGIAGGTSAPTANLSAVADFRAASAAEYAGVAGWTLDQHAQTVDGTATTSANGTVGPTITPQARGETVIAIVEHHQGATITAGTGFSEDADTGSTAETIEIEHADQGAAAAIAPTWTAGTAGNFNAVVFSLQPVVMTAQTGSLASTGLTSATTIPVTFGSAVTAGRTIVAAFSWDTASGAVITGVSDGLGNTYRLVETATDTPNVQALAVYAAINIAGGTCAPTATLSVTSQFRAAAVTELVGVNGYTVDRHAQLSGGTVAVSGTDAMTGPAITPTTNGQTIVAISELHTGTTFTAGTGFTQDVTTGATAAAFPSRLSTNGRTLIDENGFTMPTLKGFNVQPVPWAQQDMTDIFNLGGRIIRTVVFWDAFQPHQNNTDAGTCTAYNGTINISQLGPNGIDSARANGYVQAILDPQIQRQTTAGLYTIIDFPHLNVGRPAPFAADTWPSFMANGQAGEQYLANRYGNPAGAQYTKAVVGYGSNEPPIDNNALASTVLPTTEANWRTILGWVRTGGGATDWIGFISYTYAQTTLIYNLAAAGWTGAQNAWTNASTTAFNSVGGNVVIEIHDYVMCNLTTSNPLDGRQANGMTYASFQPGGYQVGTGDSGNAAYVPAGTVTRAQAQAEQVAFLAPYKQFCINANIPLMVGEWGWAGAVNTTGAVNYMTDKVAAWNDAGVIIEMQWDYDRNQAGEKFAARPTSLTGTDANGWLTATNTWMGLP